MCRTHTEKEVRKLRAILNSAVNDGTIVVACTCEPKRTDIHACPIDPDDTPFTRMLMKLKP